MADPVLIQQGIQRREDILRALWEHQAQWPGLPLSQQHLADRVGVSRRVVRHHLEMLAADGLVQRWGPDGSSFKPVDHVR